MYLHHPQIDEEPEGTCSRALGGLFWCLSIWAAIAASKESEANEASRRRQCEPSVAGGSTHSLSITPKLSPWLVDDLPVPSFLTFWLSQRIIFNGRLSNPLSLLWLEMFSREAEEKVSPWQARLLVLFLLSFSNWCSLTQKGLSEKKVWTHRIWLKQSFHLPTNQGL